jgi:hypothetical protein
MLIDTYARTSPLFGKVQVHWRTIWPVWVGELGRSWVHRGLLMFNLMCYVCQIGQLEVHSTSEHSLTTLVIIQILHM